MSLCKCELSSTDQYKVSNYTDQINMIYKDDGADVSKDDPIVKEGTCVKPAIKIPSRL